MLNRMHERLGTAGLIVSVIALVLALAGGAYAAKSGLTGKQKKEVKSIATKVAKGLVGTGQQGPAGAKGDPGAAGASGRDGTNGTPGIPGAPGKSVVLTPVAPGAEECGKRGGVLLEEEGNPTPPAEICTGEEGSPWTAGGTLPPGATETGTYFAKFDEAQGIAPISFPILLSPPPPPTANIHYATEANFIDFDGPGGSHLGCNGTSPAPAAPPGHICIYKSVLLNATFEAVHTLNNGSSGSNRAGALVVFNLGPEPEPGLVSGSFAVTGACAVGEVIAEEEIEPEKFKFFCKSA
jgi:hypothetical protein